MLSSLQRSFSYRTQGSFFPKTFALSAVCSVWLGKAMIMNLASLVNELVNALNGQLKMVSVNKLVTVVTSKNTTDFKKQSDSTAVIGNRRHFVALFKPLSYKKTLKKKFIERNTLTTA